MVTSCLEMTVLLLLLVRCYCIQDIVIQKVLLRGKKGVDPFVAILLMILFSRKQFNDVNFMIPAIMITINMITLCAKTSSSLI